MNLREVLAGFAAVEAELHVEDPYEATVLHVYTYLPAPSQQIMTPCIFHQWRRMRGSRVIGSRESDWMIRVSLLVAPFPCDTPAYSEMAAAFDEALVAALDAAVMLGGTTAFQRIVSEQADFQPGTIPWDGQHYLGIQYDYKVSAHAALPAQA